MTITGRGSPALDSLGKDLKECVTQVTCQVCLGSASPSLLHDLSWGWSLGHSIGCLLHGWHISVRQGMIHD